MSDPALTVFFATRNRAHAIPRVLEAFTGLTAPEGGWKLVVVDSGSSDTTMEVLQGFASRLPLTILSLLGIHQPSYKALHPAA